MKLLGFLKEAGLKAIGSNPAGAAALTLINTFLPKDKRLGADDTGDDALKVIEQELPKEVQAKLLDSQLELALEEEKGRTERYLAMTKADGQETRAKVVMVAMYALICLTALFIVCFAVLAFEHGIEHVNAALVGLFISVTGPFAYVVRAYMGDLRTETQSRHQLEDNKLRIPAGISGLVSVLKGSG